MHKTPQPGRECNRPVVKRSWKTDTVGRKIPEGRWAINVSIVGLREVLIVGAGGFLGTILRYAVSGIIHDALPRSPLPWGTLTVNVVGCFVVGILGALTESRQLFGPEVRVFLFLGILGGFTTFSSFGHETLSLLRAGENLQAMANVVLHLVLGLGSVWLGYILASTF